MEEFGLFRAEGDLLIPQPLARSLWKQDQMHGVATSGALGREVERAAHEAGRGDLRPARYTVDLYRAPSMGPCRTDSTIVREGRRLLVVDARLIQDDVTVARASSLFLAPSENAEGNVWVPGDMPVPPPLDVVPVSEEPRVPFFASDQPWSQNFVEHQNAGRKQTWQAAMPIVIGEESTPFQSLTGMVDSTSMVVNWGDQGVQYINSDVSFTIARLPVTREMGLSAMTWFAHDGIAVGSAVIFDREGPIGTSMITALANARRSVDFNDYDYTADTAPNSPPVA